MASLLQPMLRRSWQVVALLAWASPLQAEGAEAMFTVNGCGCKPTWTDNDGHECKDACCTLHGHDGKWCMVEDKSCEDADWGMCKLADSGESTPKPGDMCADQEHWHDSDGDSCTFYADSQWCTPEGKVGMGWHEEWGSLNEFTSNGYSGLTACCACGGGRKGLMAVAGLSNPTAQRFTFSGCRCRKNWEEEGMSCRGSCCNPDSDPAGSWCMVEDSTCEDALWGYCRSEQANIDSNQASESNRHGHCTDDKDWKDVDEEGCATYSSRNYCTEVGGYGLGWNLDWGTFGEFAVPEGRTSLQACCACGGGTHEDGHVPGQGSEAVENSNKVRTTLGACECKKSWDMDDVGKCDSFCCNVDNDPVGEWCMVKDEACEEADWGYCATDGLGVYQPTSPMRDHAHCMDFPIWKDKDGDNCDAYNLNKWCSNGQAGPGWHEEWGDVPEDAFKKCCVCGGGFNRPPAGERSGGHGNVAEQTAEAVKELLSEEPDRMWYVASGPCKIDNMGCATSGNFPNNYAALEQCEIGVIPDNAKPIHIKFFDTEYKYDVMKVNGQMYSGTRAPNGIIPTQTIFWGTDSQDQSKGWKLCPRGEVKQHKPGVTVLKVFGIVVAVLLCSCCGAVLGLWIHTYRSMPHGDGLGAGPTKIGKYAAQEDA